MEKVFFLQIKGNNYGGVWQVNKLVGEQLIKNGYDVSIISFRNDPGNNRPEVVDKRLKIMTINEKDIWHTYHLDDISKEIKKGQIISALKMLVARMKYNKTYKEDVRKLQSYICTENPDYIITSHYQLLDMIPKKYLSRTIHEQHSSFLAAVNHRATKNTLLKYNGKIGFLWLTDSTKKNAEKFGLKNNYFIYNAVRFKSGKIANVVENKKLIALSRLSEEKNIETMIDIVEEVFKDKKFFDWKLEIYGDGEEYDKLLNQIVNAGQIKLMGLTNNPQKELMKSSINLNTSKYEGFSLTILEASECGIPTIAFDFGESAKEEILNDKTGYIAMNKEDYIEKLKYLMSDAEKLKSLSKESKHYSEAFQIENIIKNWIELFEKIKAENKKEV